MKVVLVHDWLIHMRGGEKVLEALAEIFPDAPIYTLFYDRAKLSPMLKNRTVHASFLQNVPGILKFYRWLLPFMPIIIQSLKIDHADLVISTSHCVAKGIPIPKGAKHICYCHTPMRYLWGFEDEYFGKFPGVVRIFIRWIFTFLRQWDLESNQHVDLFIANSENVRTRIQKYYRRDATVIYPPADVDFFKPSNLKKDFYLVVSAFVPYKKIDLVIEAFNGLDRKLMIVGEGPLDSVYRQLKKNPDILFLGSVSDTKLRELYAEAKAVIFPTEEDFGIVPVEAQSAGTPVIAYGKGGALESVKTGLFFSEQTAESLRRAVLEFEKKEFDLSSISAKVLIFSRQSFKQTIRKHIQRLNNNHSIPYAAATE